MSFSTVHPRRTRSFRAACTAICTASALALLVGGTALAAPGRAKVPDLPTQGLVEQEHPQLDHVFVRPGVDLARYGKVMLAPIGIEVYRGPDDIILKDRDRKHATEYFSDKLTAALGPALTTQAGPGVLKLEILLTEFVPNNPFDPEKRFGGTIFKSYSVGAAAFQATLTDASSGQVVAVIADADVGAPFGSNFNLQTEYGDADHFIRRWAKQIASLLTEPPRS
ncbi:DUF3313 family protein [Oleisolibacter albus]|uniref:DUF3313 family protein n=1 Tax=Oleisolibacter albus TaxID=2171757 RepID=UPI000DF30FE5|nr:DUF3313 family protein [Oleisolibacter albus]